MRVDIGKECPGMQMGKFWQISTKLRPLVDIIFFINMALSLWIVFVIKIFHCGV